MESSVRKRSAEWWRRDAERNERGRRARLQRDSVKSPDRNMEEGWGLVRFAHEFSAAFKEARARS
ncbi:MAG: hypothetical protein AABM66_05695 [Actinomycetota bacterium]